MKKVLIAVAALSLMATPAFAWTTGDAANLQGQEQAVWQTPAATHYIGNQGGIGASGPNGAEGQMQYQGANGTVNLGYADHTYAFESGTAGASNFGAHIEGSAATIDMVTVISGTGNAAGAGAAMEVVQGSAAIGNAAAGTYAKGGSSYKSYDVGPTSAIYQEGGQGVNMATAGGTAYAATEGGTIAMNDGQGTAMIGAGASHTEVDHMGNAAVAAGNYHEYVQDSSNGMTYQHQEGVVATGAAE